MRKEFKAIIAAILAVWLFMMGFELGSYREKQNFQKEQAAQTTTAAPTSEDATTTQPAPTTADLPEITGVGNAIAEITTYPDSELSGTTTAKAKDDGDATTAEATTQDVSALSKEQIVKRATEAINTLKQTKNMTARNEETVSIKIVDCSAKSAVSILNSVISKKTGDKNVTYVFLDGKAVGHDDDGKEIKDEGEVTPNQVIPPTDAQFTLPAAGVKSASAKRNGGDVIYTLKLAEERSSIDRPVPTYNSQAIGYLKMTDMEVPGATITAADMHYPGSSVVVTVDDQGRVKQLQLYLPMDGTGSAKMGLLSGTASFEGFSNQNWTFTY